MIFFCLFDFENLTHIHGHKRNPKLNITLEIIYDLPIGFSINNIISLSQGHLKKTTVTVNPANTVSCPA